MTEFWKHKSLAEMSSHEWESLCDGCAKCCLQQLEDEDTGTLVFTDVACDLLDAQTCRCTDYANRSERVPSCVSLSIDNIEQVAEFAPPTCAYRLVYLGQDLPEWHHLKSGDASQVHDKGCSIKGRFRYQHDVVNNDLQEFVVTWPDAEN